MPTMCCGINKLEVWFYVILTVFIAIRCNKMEEQGVKLRLERVKCKCVPVFCSVKCNIKFVSREIANFHSTLKLLQPLNYMEYHVKTYYKHSNNEYRPMLLVIRGEFCKSYNLPVPVSTSPLHILLKVLGNTTNINQPCPFMPGDYYVKDFNFSIKHWTLSFIPEGRHMLNVTVYSQPNVFLLNSQIYFEVTNHGILDLRVG